MSLIPSVDGLTMYSLLILFKGDTADTAVFGIEDIVGGMDDGSEPEFDAEGDDLGFCVVGGDSSPTCWADFSLSMTALNEPLRFFAAA